MIARTKTNAPRWCGLHDADMSKQTIRPQTSSPRTLGTVSRRSEWRAREKWPTAEWRLRRHTSKRCAIQAAIFAAVMQWFRRKLSYLASRGLRAPPGKCSTPARLAPNRSIQWSGPHYLRYLCRLSMSMRNVRSLIARRTSTNRSGGVRTSLVQVPWTSPDGGGGGGGGVCSFSDFWTKC